MLDDLELTSCAIHVTIFLSTSLKSLTITSTQNDEDVPGECQYLVIDMPNLVSLTLEEIPRRTTPRGRVISENSLNLLFFTLFPEPSDSLQYY